MYVGNHEIVFLHINTATQTQIIAVIVTSTINLDVTAILFGQTVGCATSADISYNLSAVTI